MALSDEVVGLRPRASSVPPESSRGLFIRHEPNRTGYIYDTRMMAHNDGMTEEQEDRHPEGPRRISVIFNALEKKGIIQRMRRLQIREATRDEILFVHPPSLLAKMDQMEAMLIGEGKDAALAGTQGYYETLSLYVHPSTAYCARLSCGGVIESTMAVAQGTVRNSFAIVRPPGHHAEPEEHMGFCFYNNVAVAVRVVQSRTSIRKVLILDWDVHHGNGTQAAFYDDPDVLYISIHRYEGGNFYPGGTGGGVDKCGSGAGKGRNVNIPWPSGGRTDGDYIHAFQKIVIPIAYEFGPELVIISAGFDAAEGDQLGGCFVSPACYAHMTHMLSALAGGKLVVALEGGYSLKALSQSALAVGETLVGDHPPELPPVVPSDVGTETVWQVASYQSQYWNSINPKAIEPRPVDLDTFSVSQLLRAHREMDLASQYNMLRVPLAHPDLRARFDHQVLATPYLLDPNTETIVLFVHDFGNLRVELQSPLRVDVRMEHSYLIDSSRRVVEWANERRYGLIDINILMHHIVEAEEVINPIVTPQDEKRLLRTLVVYLWDNYMDLSAAKNFIIIGHGSACQSVIGLLNDRKPYLDKRTKAVVQINGMNTIPTVPKDDDDLRRWYSKKSIVVLPARHPLARDPSMALKRHGRLLPCGEEKAIKVLDWAVSHVLKAIVDPRINPISSQDNQSKSHTNTSVMNGDADIEML
ncbi:histone deacetylase complex protein [Dacryopinax primogenitus]|uniref:histone deacetylase n=1 Tax=Dacryopinax primogenitus (strain DJM 731) TaxID=1858805 RepID=M5G1D6_DACPD|nr:histone deacetylase complex protein [Dacryopinax primogenitus]EJU04046.1 histone deacetylase complex protein [Dacryopinax primogenitus]